MRSSPAIKIEETILLIERGRLELPPNADPASFILSDGKRTGEERQREILSVKELIDRYKDELQPGAKEESTLPGERIHFKHLLKHLRASSAAQALSVGDIQSYVTKRSKDRWHGKTIASQTIKKELTTLRLVWNWAVERGYLDGPSPVRGIQYSKAEEKQIFRTAQEIERIIKRGGLSDDEEADLWEGLYLAREEIGGLLAHVEATARNSLVYSYLATQL
jgi:CRISPR/Cas system-associated exonuclease Cas4 (RecB family)